MYVLSSDLPTGCNPFGRVSAPVWVYHGLQSPQGWVTCRLLSTRVSHRSQSLQGFVYLLWHGLPACSLQSIQGASLLQCAASTGGSPSEGAAPVAQTAWQCSPPLVLLCSLLSLRVSPLVYPLTCPPPYLHLSPAPHSCHSFLKIYEQQHHTYSSDKLEFLVCNGLFPSASKLSRINCAHNSPWSVPSPGTLTASQHWNPAVCAQDNPHR